MRRFLRKRREEDDFPGEYEAPESELGSEESTFDASSLDEPCSDEENLVDNRER